MGYRFLPVAILLAIAHGCCGGCEKSVPTRSAADLVADADSQEEANPLAALGLYVQAASLSPDDPSIQVRVAHAAIDSKQPREAIAAISRLRKLVPTPDGAQEAVIADLEKSAAALQANPPSGASPASPAGDVAQAAPQGAKPTTSRPDEKVSGHVKALVAIAMEQIKDVKSWDAAAEAAEEARSIAPDSPEAVLACAIVYDQQGRWIQSRSDYERYCQLDDRSDRFVRARVRLSAINALLDAAEGKVAKLLKEVNEAHLEYGLVGSPSKQRIELDIAMMHAYGEVVPKSSERKVYWLLRAYKDKVPKHKDETPTYSKIVVDLNGKSDEAAKSAPEQTQANTPSNGRNKITVDGVLKAQNKTPQTQVQSMDQAELDLGEVSFQLGLALETGDGVEKNRGQATEYYGIASKYKPAAIVKFGEMYEFDDSGRYPAGWRQLYAMQWYKSAAGTGDAYCMYYYGRRLELGTGVERDVDAAITLYERAADKGSKDAMQELAVLYGDGTRAPNDRRKAAEWMKQAARSGSIEAKAYLKANGIE